MCFRNKPKCKYNFDSPSTPLSEARAPHARRWRRRTWWAPPVRCPRRRRRKRTTRTTGGLYTTSFMSSPSYQTCKRNMETGGERSRSPSPGRAWRSMKRRLFSSRARSISYICRGRTQRAWAGVRWSCWTSSSILGRVRCLRNCAICPVRKECALLASAVEKQAISL